MVFGAGIRRGSLGIDRKRHQIEVMLQVSKFPPQVCGTGPTRTIPKHWPRARTLDTVTGLAVVHTRPRAHRGNTFYEIFEKRARTTMTDDGLQQKHTTITSHWNVAICMPSGAFGWAFRVPEGSEAYGQGPVGNDSPVEGPTMTK